MTTNETMMMLLIGIIVIFLILSIICVILLLKVYLKNRNKLIELARYKINMVNTPIDFNVSLLLDQFIEENFNEYLLLNVPPSPNGLEYVSDEREEEMRKDMVEIVSSNISKVLLERLSLYYNINNIGKILANRIYIVVMNYAIQSRIQIDDEDLPDYTDSSVLK